MEEFINKWQTLIGSSLGPFLAVVLSALGFWIKSIIEGIKERKEFLRRVEISMARSLNDTFVIRAQLKWFSKEIQKLADKAKSITDNKTFFFSRINFPITREVYRDIDMPNFKLKSYYLHNKIMWVDAGVKEMNEIISNFKGDFENLIRQNEILLTTMRDNPNPQIQRNAYVRNLEGFVGAINEYVSKSIPMSTEIMTQIKTYNRHLRKACGFLYRWKQEGVSFNIFCKKIELMNIANDLDSLERIDKEIKEEVELVLANAEERSKKLEQN